MDPGDHRGADHQRGAPHALGAKGHRLDAAAPRAEPRAALRRRAGTRSALRRRAQAAAEGSRGPGQFRQVPVPPRARDRAGAGIGSWNWFWLFPLLMVYFISGVAETNRAPFDVAEGESEIVAGFHVEYSGIAFALFFLAEYANMILISTLTAVFFFGGWQGPFEGYPRLGATFLGQPSFVWLLIKVFVLVFFFLWFR